MSSTVFTQTPCNVGFCVPYSGVRVLPSKQVRHEKYSIAGSRFLVTESEEICPFVSQPSTIKYET